MAPKNKVSTTTKPTMEIPVLDIEGKEYDKYLIRVKDWVDLSGVKKSAQARYLRSKLDGIAFDTVSSIDEAILASDIGVAAVLEKLDSLYRPDKLNHGRTIYRKYKNLRRQEDESMVIYIQKFLNLHTEVKKYNTEIKFYDDSWVAIDLLDSCLLSDENEKIVTAQMKSPANLENLTEILKRVFTSKADETTTAPTADLGNQASDIFVAKSASDNRRTYRSPSPRHRRAYRSPSPRNRSSREERTERNGPYRRKNSMGDDGRIRKCNICKSEYHFYRYCPDYKGENGKRSKNFLSI